MKLDTDEPIGKMFATVSEMRRAMVEISQHVQDRKAHQLWSSGLRFITPYLPPEKPRSERPPPNESDEEDGEVFCSCAYAGVSCFHHNDRQLRLTLPAQAPECIHFVAVSYCLSSTTAASYAGSPFLMHYANGTARRPRCPGSLLDRAIQFAAWKDRAFIWIDQECIDQDDLGDLAVGIQSMDLVYQQACECLAVLEVCIDSQRHIDALTLLLENSMEIKSPEWLQNTCECLQMILADPWFSRSWCLQESTAGNQQMTLLIKHGDCIDVPDLLESVVDGCFELDLVSLHNALSAFQPEPLHLHPQSPHSALYTAYQQVLDDWYDNMAPDVGYIYDANSRTICNAAQALCFLQRRQNLVPADRIAIMANLCNYDKRLDPLALDQAGFGLSICVTVQAVINGDFSILTGYDDFVKSGKRGRKSRLLARPRDRDRDDDGNDDDHAANRPFTWSMPTTATLANLSYFDHDAEPLRAVVDSNSLGEGLRMAGSIWIAERWIDLSHVMAEVRARSPPLVLSQARVNGDWDEEQFSPDPIFDEARVNFLIFLICDLARRGYTQMAQVIWQEFRLHPTKLQQDESDEVRRFGEADFEDVIDVPTAQVKWPNPIRNRFLHGKTRPHPFADLNRRGIQALMQMAMSDEGFVISRPLRTTSDTPSSYAGVFGTAHIGETVFVPRILHGRMIHYGWYPHNWIVRLKGDFSSGKAVCVSCIGTTCGIWKGGQEHEDWVVLQ